MLGKIEGRRSWWGAGTEDDGWMASLNQWT